MLFRSISIPAFVASVAESKTERKCFFCGVAEILFQVCKGRHGGGASASGLPAASSSCAWCARRVRAGSAPVGHHWNRPCDKRLVAIQNPWPSYANSLIAVRRRVRKMKTQPEKGSASNFSRHNCAKASMPLRFCGAPQNRKYALSIDMRSSSKTRTPRCVVCFIGNHRALMLNSA